MNEFADIFGATGATFGSPVENTVLCLLLSFVLGQAIAWTYMYTHAGLSYSRMFTQSLVLLTMIVALVMLVIGNNIVTAFGLLGALAIIRFRNVLKDTRDTVFVFLALVIGMGVGSFKPVVAVVGVIGVLLAAAVLWATSFGTPNRFDGLLSLVLSDRVREPDDPDGVLSRFCRSVQRVSFSQSAGMSTSESVLQVRLRDPSEAALLVTEIRQAEGVLDAALVLHEEVSEV